MPRTQRTGNRGRQKACLPYSQSGMAGRGTRRLEGLSPGKGLRLGTDSLSSTGMGLHLCPQLLPLCPGHVLRPAAAQGQQEGWELGAPRQTDLLHPLLRLRLITAPVLGPCPPVWRPHHLSQDTFSASPSGVSMRNGLFCTPREQQTCYTLLDDA